MIEKNIVNFKRYSRQIILKDIDVTGQKKLSYASVLVIGSGGLGSSALFYLAAAGVGRIGIVDSDWVELSNLNRQILFNEKEIGKSKTSSAAEKLRAFNSSISIEENDGFFDSSNASRLVEKYDFVIDAVDNFETKFLINDACVLNKRPFVHAGIEAFGGQIMTVIPEKSPCLRCLMDQPPHEKDEKQQPIGILGASAGVIGSIQAAEAIKYFIGTGDLLTGRLLNVSLKNMRFKILKYSKDSLCLVCSPEKIISRIDPEKWTPYLEKPA
ncbi:MAG: HesA/MoeB/ThiF family protein [Elusimicrobia bacterium]|nr:HesA/MoeB/ThiF family protein [Elusimicrobiota bacterium]